MDLIQTKMKEKIWYFAPVFSSEILTTMDNVFITTAVHVLTSFISYSVYMSEYIYGNLFDIEIRTKSKVRWMMSIGQLVSNILYHV